jgi:YfiH family protein
VNETTPVGPVLELGTVCALASIPGLVHGFERKRPGAAGESRGDTRSRMAGALASQGRLLVLHQVHGASVAVAPFEGTPEADASVASEPGLILGIETADCMPVLLVDSERRLVAAAHAGWRGAAAGVAAAAVEALTVRGARPDELQAALGPAIGACCYEVGDELRDTFGPEGAVFFRPGPRGRPHLDLRAAVATQLTRAGLPAERIHHLAECTFCRGDRYYSYRRDGAGAGRMISFVGFARQ